jgi:hypothetical protein
LATSESDLKEQLSDLDWGTASVTANGATEPELPAPTPPVSEGLDTLDVAVAGVSPPKPRRQARKARVARQPVAQALLDAVKEGATVAANAPTRAPGTRRGRNTAPDVLIQAGESPAVLALFEAMWKDVGSKLARGIGRPKASRQDAAIGWYALLLAMRERDAAKP